MGGVVGLVIWIWMAIANYKGRQWARVVASGLFGLDSLVFVGSLALLQNNNNVSTFTLVLSVAQ
ncbi:MAG TPA: hypothetical protein VFN61_15335 [Acidimicrobiales bacterium]|nr:hypothetical protein [Acidimicrobiales bacterium]